MRYVRTKDGVFESKTTERGKFIHIPTDNEIAKMHGDNWVWVLEENIIAQADTIEELCDYVIRKPFGSVDDRPFVLKTIVHKGYLDRNNYEEVREVLRQQHKGQENGDKATIYLAIPTDRAITYVAQMNEKGELELL